MRHLRGIDCIRGCRSLVLFVGCGLMVRSVVEDDADGLRVSSPPSRPDAGHASRRATIPEPAAFFRSTSSSPNARRRSSRRPSCSPAGRRSSRCLRKGRDRRPDRACGCERRRHRREAGYFSDAGHRAQERSRLHHADMSAAEPVAVISETLARRLWPDGSGLGRRVRGVELTEGGRPPGRGGRSWVWRRTSARPMRTPSLAISTFRCRRRHSAVSVRSTSEPIGRRHSLLEDMRGWRRNSIRTR